MNKPTRNRFCHVLRLVACLLILAAAAAAGNGRVFGHALFPAAGSAQPDPTVLLFRPVTLSSAAALLVLLLAAIVPLWVKSRVWRTVQLVLDVAVLGFWSGLFLSNARLVAWAGASLPDDAAHSAASLLMIAMAFLYPLFGHPSHYCLHACPFGAAQELAGRLPFPKWRLPPRLVRWLETFRRGLWVALMLALWCGPFSAWMGWELFGAFAWRAVPPLLVCLALSFAALSAFVPRAYCRFVCPTGTLFKLCESNGPNPGSHMKASNFLNVVLAAAVLLLCARLYFTANPPSPAASVAGRDATANAAQESVVVDSTDLAPGVMGYGGPVPVEVEVRGGVVARVSPKLPNDETPMFFAKLEEAGLWQAWDGMAVGQAVTAEVAAVASATYSSKAAIANVRAALVSAAGQKAPAPAATNAPPAPAAADDFALAALGVDAGAAVAALVPPPAEAFREFDVHGEFAGNPFDFFTGRGLLLCAGDREASNAMTIGWGALGTLWGRNDAVTVYVAESRHTKGFMDRASRFTVMAFDKERQADILDYMGRHSGRDGDKAAALGLHVAFTEDGTPYYEEARMVLECELMYAAPFDPAGMKDVPREFYANFPAGVHTMYVGRIVRALKK